jgi:acyl carrier protein
MAIMPEILEGMAIIFRSELDSPKLKLQPNDNQDNIAGWDSLAHIRIIAALEKKFAIEFELEEIEELTSITRLSNAVFNRMASR